MKTSPPRHTHRETPRLSGNRVAPEFSPLAQYSPSETHILRGPSKTEVGVHTESYPWRKIAPRKDAPFLTTPWVIIDQHTLKNIITKTHTYRWMPTEMGTRSEHPRNPGPGNECATIWPRSERKLPVLGRFGPRGAQGHTTFPHARGPKHAVIDMLVHHGCAGHPAGLTSFQGELPAHRHMDTRRCLQNTTSRNKHPNTRHRWLPDTVEAVCFCLPAPVSRERPMSPPPPKGSQNSTYLPA